MKKQPIRSGLDLLTAAEQVDLGKDFRELEKAWRMLLALLHCFALSFCTSSYGQVLDTSFNPVVNGAVHCMLVQTDSKILIGGEFTEVDGIQRKYLARLNSDGTLDSQFNANVDGGRVLCLVQKSLEEIVFGGEFTTVGGVQRNRLAKISSIGALDSAFNPNINGVVKALVQHGENHYLLGGTFTTVGDQSQAYLARIGLGGVLDQTFNPTILAPTTPPIHEVGSGVYSLAVREDGKVLLGGFFTSVNGYGRISLARLKDNGTIDEAFTPNLSNPAYLPEPTAVVSKVVSMSDDSILVGGSFDRVDGARRQYYVRLTAAGRADSRNQIEYQYLTRWVYSIALQPEGTVLIGGRGGMIDGWNDPKIAKMNSNGSFDSGFDADIEGKWIDHPGGSSYQEAIMRTVIQQPNGEILAGGLFYSVKGVIQENIARIYIGPAILDHPESKSIYLGEDVLLSVNAQGGGELSYKWFKNGEEVSGATENTLSIPKAHFRDSGNYTVVVSNAAGPTTSNVATLTVVRPAPNATISPSAPQVMSVGDTVTFAATVASGIAPFTFQWRKDGKSISNAKAQTLALSNLQRTQAGEYDVVVRNSHGVAVSNKVSLSFDPLVVVPGPPATIDRKVGETATFSVNMPGASFQWLKNGKVIPGQNINTLSFTVSDASAAGLYSVVVSTSAGKVTTDAAQLRITDDGLLIYKLSATAKAYEGTSSTSSAITGFLALDRAGQRGGMIFNAKQGTISVHQIEIHGNLDSTSTGPVPRSRTVVSEMEGGELAMWVSGADSLLKISKTDTTVGPAAMKGFMNSISVGSDLHIEEATLSMSIDAANSAITRETGESLENALLRLSQELQAKGSAFVE